jgi:hypothetical protein
MIVQCRPLTFIPRLLPDQTLYSWVSEYHEKSGNRSEEQTLESLFGSAGAGRHFHLPSHLDAFCAATQGTLGNPRQLIKLATILPVFLCFRNTSEIERTMLRLCGTQTAGISQTLGISKHLLAGSLPRRLCYECAREDEQQYGAAYWHRSQQLPGAFVCARHSIPLLVLPIDYRTKRRKAFLTPQAELSVRNANLSSPTVPKKAQLILIRLAFLAEQMASQGLGHGCSKVRTKAVFLDALEQRRLSGNNDTDFLQIKRNFEAHFEDLKGFSGIEPLLFQRSLSLISYITSMSRSDASPLEYMLLIDWLFGGWANFCQASSVYENTCR